MFRDCLEGKFAMPGSAGTGKPLPGSSSSKDGPAGDAPPKLCQPCGRLYNARLDALQKRHAEEIAKLQKSVRQWTAKFDARLEASAIAHRFREREDELRVRIEALEQELGRARVELREKRATFDTHMASTLRHKAIAKELAATKEQLGAARARVAELEKSAMQVCAGLCVCWVVALLMVFIAGLGCGRPRGQAPRSDAPRPPGPRCLARAGGPAGASAGRRAAAVEDGRAVRGGSALRLPLAPRRVQSRRGARAGDEAAQEGGWGWRE